MSHKPLTIFASAEKARTALSELDDSRQYQIRYRHIHDDYVIERRPIETGMRVEVSPGSDAWMRGARFGTVLAADDESATVKLDKVRKRMRFNLTDLFPLEP